MLVNPINSFRSLNIQRKNSIKAEAPRTDLPSFKSAEYKEAFKRCYNRIASSYVYDNEGIYKELMTKIVKMEGFNAHESYKHLFTPNSYYSLIMGLREEQPDIFSDLNYNGYEKPFLIMRKNDKPLVSILNLGALGNMFQQIFNRKSNSFVCFHGLDEQKDLVICLGQNYHNKPIQYISDEGIGSIISAHIWSKL
ncbi:hypothetical protein J6R97_00360 [bacterium]|nr:hypothetical protein [bacterium]